MYSFGKMCALFTPNFHNPKVLLFEFKDIFSVINFRGVNEFAEINSLSFREF